jgi:putative ABC transport system permease protein
MARRRVPGVRRRPGPLHLLLSRPWVRAPLAAFGQPGASAAVLVATAVLGIAAATAPLFLAGAASGALHRAVATCPDSYAPGITNRPEDLSFDPSLPLPAARYAVTEDAAVRRVLDSRGVAFGERTMLLPAGSRDGFLTVAAHGDEESVLGYARPSALGNVTVLRGQPGAPGLWLPDTLAKRLGVDAGDTVLARGRPEPVAGVYRDLNDPSYGGSLPRAWCRYAGLIVAPIGDAGPPVRPLVILDDRTLLALAGTDRPRSTWSAALDPATARAGDAAATATALLGAGASVFQTPGLVGSYQEEVTLAGAVGRSGQVREALAVATRPAAYAAVLVALGLVAAAGGYWAERRAGEVRLLAARGLGPAGLGGKAVLEMIGPAVAGALLGWGATITVAPHLGPTSLLDDGADTGALRTVAGALAIGLVALGAVAGLRGRSAGERPIGLARSRWVLVPWELLLVGGAVWAFLRLRERGAVSGGGEAVRISPLVVGLPLLALTGLTVLVVRLIGLPAGRLHALGGRLPVPGFLAVRRLTAVRAVSAGVLVAVALPVGVLVVCASLSASVQGTVDSKSATYVGAAVALRTDATPGVYAAESPAGTPVSLLPEAKDTFSRELPVLAVDPAGFARYAYWRGGFAAASLPQLLARLGPATDGSLPAILAGGDGTAVDHVSLDALTLPVHVVARVATFPGMRSVATPLLVVDRHALPALGPYVARSEEVWTRPADAGAATAALGAQGLHVTGQVSGDTIVRNTDLYPLTWTFGYVQVLAGLAGVIGVTALLLYLAARQRSRTAAYVLSRRMGLTRRAHLASLLAELAIAVGLGAVAGVGLARLVLDPSVRVLHLEPGRPPYRALLVVSGPAVLAVLAGAVLLVLLGALSTQLVADRARAADVLRGVE